MVPRENAAKCNGTVGKGEVLLKIPLHHDCRSSAKMTEPIKCLV